MPSALPTLKRQESPLADPAYQCELLEAGSERLKALPRFAAKLAGSGLLPLRPLPLQVLQVNVGKLCNQTCKHCHVDAGPERDEVMTRATLEACLDALRRFAVDTLDVTGGAPEMNPHFRWFVEQARPLVRRLMVRCNLTILVAGKRTQVLKRADVFADRRGKVLLLDEPDILAARVSQDITEGVHSAPGSWMRRSGPTWGQPT